MEAICLMPRPPLPAALVRRGTERLLRRTRSRGDKRQRRALPIAPFYAIFAPSDVLGVSQIDLDLT
jgi:hypothetical protein